MDRMCITCFSKSSEPEWCPECVDTKKVESDDVQSITTFLQAAFMPVDTFMSERQ